MIKKDATNVNPVTFVVTRPPKNLPMVGPMDGGYADNYEEEESSESEVKYTNNGQKNAYLFKLVLKLNTVLLLKRCFRIMLTVV